MRGLGPGEAVARINASHDSGAGAGGNDARVVPGESVLVGREEELGLLLAGVAHASAGRGRLFLLAGEPGIGKSRLVEELAVEARRTNVRVLWGRCWEAGGAPAHWPWVQALRAYVREAEPEVLRRQLGDGAADVAQLLPEVRQVLAGVGQPASVDSDSARFRLFDATAGLLRNIAKDTPMLLVLEDMHAADAPSLILLQFLAQSLVDARVMIVVTYRDVEVSRGHPLGPAVVELAREPTTRRIHLSGLAVPDVRRFIEVSTGAIPSQALVEAVAHQTDGNPMFVGEIVKLLASEGRLGSDTAVPLKPVPQAIRDVIGRRLGHVSERSHHVLGIASVLGREFRLDLLAAISDHTRDELLDVLDEAIAARLVEDNTAAGGGLRFSHSLIRDTLYEDIAGSRRVRLHLRAGEVIEQSRNARPELLAALAHHFFAAIPMGETRRATDYAIRAAEVALRGLAFEEAARLYRMALQAMDLAHEADDATRLDVLLALGDALNRAGDADAARPEFISAASIARRRGDARALARAALGYGGRLAWAAIRGDLQFVPLLEEAIAALGDTPSTMRVMLIARLAAGPLRDSPDPTRRHMLSAEAVDMARALGDPATLAYALEARQGAVVGPDSRAETLRISDELERLAAQLGDSEKAVMAHMQRCQVRLYEADIRGVRTARDAMARGVQQLRQGPQRWFLLGTDATLAILDGRFDEAESLSGQAYEAGKRLESFVGFAHHLQLLWIWIERGRIEDAKTLFGESVERFRLYPLWRAALPYLQLRFGSREQAGAALEDALAEPRTVKEDFLLGESLLADAAADLADRPASAQLYEGLRPYASLVAGDLPDVAWGSLERPMGRLAAVLGRTDDAEQHLRAAIATDDRMGARPWAAHSRYAYAQLLLERGRSGDREAAATLLAAALATAEKLGMGRLASEVMARLGELRPTRAAAEPGSNASAGARATVAIQAAPLEGTIALEGEYWTIEYEGRVVRLRDTKGMRIIARLLSAPGRPHAALDLERIDNPDNVEVSRVVAGGDAGELLDDEARRAYRGRIAELRVAIADAEEAGNGAGAGPMREEMDLLVHELSRALGLGGRPRHAGSIAERARLNVTRAVRSSLRRIATADPGLAAHLGATVHTGTLCHYTPDPRSSVTWRLSRADGAGC